MTSGYKTHEESNMGKYNYAHDEEWVAKIAKVTGIAPERICLERPNGNAGKFITVGILGGTDFERTAAHARLQENPNLIYGKFLSAHQPPVAQCCSICGERLKVVEQYDRKTRSVSAKSRCSNPLCSNGKHWMPAYRPTSAKPLSPAMALTVDHGYDEPGDWGQRKPAPPEHLTRQMCKETMELLDQQSLSRPEQNRCAHQLAVGVWVRSKSHGWLGTITNAKGSPEKKTLWAVQFVGRSPFGVDAPAAIPTEELVRDYEVVEPPAPAWQPQLNQWIRHKKTYRSGCINCRTESNRGVQWSVRFTDMDYPVDLTTEELVEHYEPEAVSAIMNPPVDHSATMETVRALNAREREELRKKQTEELHKMWNTQSDVECMKMKVMAGLNVTEEQLEKYSSVRALDGNYAAGAFGKVMSPELMEKLKETAAKLSPIGACTGRLSSSMPNQAAFPRQEHVYTEEMLVKNREGVCGRLRRVEGKYWQVQDIRLSTVQLPSGDDRTELMSATEIVLKGWKPCVPENEPNQNQDVFKREYLGEFLPALPAWPEHLDNSWVGRALIHRQSGERVSLGHYAVGVWHVHVPGQGTWRFTEQDILKLFAPAPPLRSEAMKVNFDFLYGSNKSNFKP